jgi:hypothetical protein
MTSEILKGSSQGGLANKQGRVLESTIITLFRQHSFSVVPYQKWMKDSSAYGEELLLTDAPYTSIYGHQGKTEFLLQSKRLNKSTRIECKWQQSSGSVDEKFPYLYLNCVFAMPENEVIIVLDGGGAKPSAVAWLRNASVTRHLIPDEMQEKTINVFTLAEFIGWANRIVR